MATDDDRNDGRSRRALIEVSPDLAARFGDPRLVLALVAAIAGRVALLIGYFGVSGTLDPAKQLPVPDQRRRRRPLPARPGRGPAVLRRPRRHPGRHRPAAGHGRASSASRSPTCRPRLEEPLPAPAPAARTPPPQLADRTLDDRLAPVRHLRPGGREHLRDRGHGPRRHLPHDRAVQLRPRRHRDGRGLRLPPAAGGGRPADVARRRCSPSACSRRCSGIAIDRLLFRDVDQAAQATKVVLTMGLLIVLQGGAVAIFGATAKRVAAVPARQDATFRVAVDQRRVGPADHRAHRPRRARRPHRVLPLAAGPAPRCGRSSTTASSSRRPASRRSRLSALTWALGGATAGLAGILFSPLLGLDSAILTLLVVQAYAAAIFGRLTSLPRTFVGALVLGLAGLAQPQGVRVAAHAAQRPAAEHPVPLPLRRPGARPAAARLRELGTSAPWTGTVQAGSSSWWPLLVVLLPLAALLSRDARVQPRLRARDRLRVPQPHRAHRHVGAHLARPGRPRRHRRVRLRPLRRRRRAVPARARPVAGSSSCRSASPSPCPRCACRACSSRWRPSAFGQLIDGLLFGTWTWFSGGSDGLRGGRPVGPATRTAWYVAFVVVVLAADRRSRSASCAAPGLGRTLVALRDSPAAADALGVDPLWPRVAIFSISAFLAGVAGGLYAGLLEGAERGVLQHLHVAAVADDRRGRRHPERVRRGGRRAALLLRARPVLRRRHPVAVAHPAVRRRRHAAGPPPGRPRRPGRRALARPPDRRPPTGTPGRGGTSMAERGAWLTPFLVGRRDHRALRRAQSRSTTCRSRPTAARSSASSAPTARARPRCSAPSPARSSPERGSVRLGGRRRHPVAVAPPGPGRPRPHVPAARGVRLDDRPREPAPTPPRPPPSAPARSACSSAAATAAPTWPSRPSTSWASAPWPTSGPPTCRPGLARLVELGRALCAEPDAAAARRAVVGPRRGRDRGAGRAHRRGGAPPATSAWCSSSTT